MHVILRGIDRTAMFFAEGDYRVFSGTLAALAESESVRVHAYVLMTNHVHLLMTPATERGPARLMKGLGQRCCIWTLPMQTRRDALGTEGSSPTRSRKTC